MEIFSVYSTESPANRPPPPKKNPVAKYYPKWDLTPGTSDFQAMHATTELLLLLLLVSNIKSSYSVLMLY